jgi:hypothetical protein
MLGSIIIISTGSQILGDGPIYIYIKLFIFTDCDNYIILFLTINNLVYVLDYLFFMLNKLKTHIDALC